MIFQGVDLRQYSKEIEKDLLDVENASVQDCILSGKAIIFFLKVCFIMMGESST